MSSRQRRWIDRLSRPRTLSTIAAAAIVGTATGVAFANVGAVAPLLPATDGAEHISIGALSKEHTQHSRRLGALLQGSDLEKVADVRVTDLRQVADRTNERLYVAPTRGNWVCVVIESKALDWVPASSCRPKSELDKHPVAVEIVGGNSTLVGGIVPDGYTEAKWGTARAPVTDNGFVLAHSSAGAITVTGPGRPSLAIPDAGRMAPEQSTSPRG